VSISGGYIAAAFAEAEEGAGPMGLRARKKLRLRHRIIAVSAERFRTQGYDHTTVDELCDELEISKATFFRYFPTKDVVLRELGASMLSGVIASTDQQGAATDRLTSITTKVEAGCVSDPALARAMVVAGAADPSRVASAAHDPAGPLGQLASVIGSGLDRGEFKSAVPAGSLALVLAAATYGVVAQWVHGEQTDRPMVADALAVFLHGVGV
jgi:AcrR family transcriptional regulator